MKKIVKEMKFPTFLSAVESYGVIHKPSVDCKVQKHGHRLSPLPVATPEKRDKSEAE